MKIPKNMTEDQVVDIITNVAHRLAPKFTFAFYETEDIEQEAFMLGVEALGRYDDTKPLENFLYTHISNRLKNFKRDNYYRFDHGDAQKIQDRKKSILDAADIDNFKFISAETEVSDDVHMKEVRDLIDKKLPADLRSDYLRLKSNTPLPKTRRDYIIHIIEEIIESENDQGN